MVAEEFHRLLQRQIRKYLPQDSPVPENSLPFLRAISETYLHADEDRKLVERSLEISSHELSQRNSEIRAIFKALPDAIFRVQTDGRILDYKAAAADDIFASTASKLIGQYFYQIYDDKVIEKKFKEALHAMVQNKDLPAVEYSYQLGGKHYYFEARLQPLPQNQIVIVVRNISDRVQALTDLKASEERYALAAEGANDGLWDWDLRTNKIYYSARWKAMLGFENDEIADTPDEWFSRIHPNDVPIVKGAIETHKNTETPHIEVEYRIRHKKNFYIWVLTRGISILNENKKAYRIAGSQSDITNRKEAEEHLRHDALYDKLTSLPNRALFMDRLNTAFQRSQRHPHYLYSVLFIDIDRFKNINDSLGHLSGDNLLIVVAERLKKCVRNVDSIARFGGDEFTVLLDDIKNARDATIIAERIKEAIAQPITINGQEIFTTVSIGITLNTYNKIEKAEEMLRDADTAMYRAKMMGRDNYAVFNEQMHARVKERLSLENDLRMAIANQEFKVYYQPIVSLKDGHIQGMEALIRWEHPHRGLIHPAEFIPVTEETGMILTIGEWVLRTVCQQAKQWEDMGYPGIEIAVNFSARQFEDKNLPELVKKIVQETQRKSFTLDIEITETIAMRDIDFSIKILKDLKKIGLNIAIDDFGIGYSSFMCLKLFPIDVLKIDRTFVHDIMVNDESKAIASSVIALSRNLNLKVIAEGVETKEQLWFLQEQRCDAAQGYLFSKPVPAQQALQLLQSRQPLF
jgi:diguanylate cyclase (GGDEF)-like protein/PAS domain S-box-containing protein